MDVSSRPKCVFIGSASVGKTELINACTLKQRELAHIAGDDAVADIVFEEVRFGADLNLKSDSRRKSSAQAADCLAICVDVTDGRSLTDAQSFMLAISSTPALVFVLGTKADIVAERRVPFAALEDFATKWLLVCPSVFDVSCKHDVGIGLFLQIMTSRLSSPRGVGAQYPSDAVRHRASQLGRAWLSTSQPAVSSSRLSQSSLTRGPAHAGAPSPNPPSQLDLSSSTLGHVHAEAHCPNPPPRLDNSSPPLRHAHAGARSPSPPPRHSVSSSHPRHAEDMSPPPLPVLTARNRPAGSSSSPAAVPVATTTQHQHHANCVKSTTAAEEYRPLLRIEFLPGRTFEVDLIQFAQNTDLYIDRFVKELRDGGYALGKTRSDIVRRIAIALGAKQEDVSPTLWHKTDSAPHRSPHDPVVSRLEVTVGRGTTAIFIVKDDDDVFAKAYAFCKQHRVHHKFAPVIAVEALKSASLRQRVDATRSWTSPSKDSRSANAQTRDHHSTSHTSLQSLPAHPSDISLLGVNDPLRYAHDMGISPDDSATDGSDSRKDSRRLNAVDEDSLDPITCSDAHYMSRLRWISATH